MCLCVFNNSWRDMYESGGLPQETEEPTVWKESDPLKLDRCYTCTSPETTSVVAVYSEFYALTHCMPSNSIAIFHAFVQEVTCETDAFLAVILKQQTDQCTGHNYTIDWIPSCHRFHAFRTSPVIKLLSVNGWFFVGALKYCTCLYIFNMSCATVVSSWHTSHPPQHTTLTNTTLVRRFTRTKRGSLNNTCSDTTLQLDHLLHSQRWSILLSSF